jgi:hypothetical protein
MVNYYLDHGRGVSQWVIFENIAVSHRPSAVSPQKALRPSADRTSQNEKNKLKLGLFGLPKNTKRGLTAQSTVLSNWGWAFVFNKSAMPGGLLAEERRQRDVRIAEIAESGKGETCEPYANLGCPGMMSLKPTPIWDGYGRGYPSDRVIR